jgi:hypothetical protein
VTPDHYTDGTASDNELPPDLAALAPPPQPHPLLVLRDNPWVVGSILAGIIALSLWDGALTTFELSTGIAREGNPVLSALIGVHPSLAVFFKLGMTALIVVLMWRGRHSALIRVLMVATLVGYAALIAYHLGNLSGYGIV